LKTVIRGIVDTAPVTTAPGPDLLLIRHGETTWSRSGRHTSRTDLPLTELGERQAAALRSFLEGGRFALVLSSPLLRALRTAELAGFPEPVIDPYLKEWDYGECEGKTTAEIRADVPRWSVWSHQCPGGESIDQVAARADRVIARVRACPAGSTVVAFAHGHILRVLAARWLGAAPQAGRWFALGTAAVSTLGWEHDTAVVRLWNQRVEVEK
jgi:broad specificity phosphatase PhoE